MVLPLVDPTDSDNWVIPLEDARTACGFPITDTSRDDTLRIHLTGVTPILEDIVGPILPRDLVEWHDGGSATVKTLYAPLTAVTAVSESYGNYVRTLTAQPLDGSSFDAYGYTVDLATGVLTRRASGVVVAFADGRSSIKVAYTAGRSTMPANLRSAARRLVRHLYQSEQQAATRPTGGGGPEPMAVTPTGFAVPRAVIELCGPDARIPGMS